MEAHSSAFRSIPVRSGPFLLLYAPNVITVQSVVMLNTNTEVFRIHDMNTLNKIGDLKYNGKYFMYLFYYKKIFLL